MSMEEKHTFKSFANGRALTSHLFNLYLHSNPHEYQNHQQDFQSKNNTFRSVDSEVLFAGGVTVTVTPNAAVARGSVSEPESSRNATVRRRSKRIRKPEVSWFGDRRHFHQLDRCNQSQYLKKSMIVNESSLVDPDSVSSISDFSPEEDVAYCLMMLSRDRWIEEHQKPDDEFDDEEKEDENDSDTDSESEREILNVKRTPARSKYRCDTCNKVFRSYQALGGHRASHKKIKLSHHNSNHQTQNVSMEDKIHECPVCFKVFASGQALGGHKRSHFTASSSAITAAKPVTKQRINLIDLNLPATIEDDDVSQIEVSAVSDGEFVKPH
ncbi:Zinc finger, C2H2 [Cynara cardunculus var. scolymus]|uniref:Zinc finger, C2H2 n=1 Tax=Cynara cardunculus var. scolymus TaxID=59895 RepID=A0A103XEI6_CYNCS|nr:Zinc finger, C2H2 [Cynara cardunculus var. scolymus]